MGRKYRKQEKGRRGENTGSRIEERRGDNTGGRIKERK